MRKINAHYIINLARQILGEYCTKEAARYNASIEEEHADLLKGSSGHLTADDLMIDRQDAVQYVLVEPAAVIQCDGLLSELAIERVWEMKSETLGRIIACGLKVGEICETTFRKTPFTTILEDANWPKDQLNGRDLLEVTAAAVILAAAYDYCVVLEREKRGEGKFEEVGRAYLAKGKEVVT